MPQANFAYAPPANDPAGVPLAVSIFADEPARREMLREDAEAAGLHIARLGDVSALLDGNAQSIGDVVLIDCPEAGAEHMAALARADVRAAQSGAHLVVSTSLDMLDTVFSCLDQSAPQILVNPGRAERAIALGRALAGAPARRLRDLTDSDRLALLRLTEHVGQIAERLERLNVLPSADRDDDGVFRFESPRKTWSGSDGSAGDRLVRAARPPLPEPRLIRRIIRQRQLRARFFDGDLFADPAWDMLLDLTAARGEFNRVSVTSLCIASGVPPTTALRWISQMIDAGLFERVEDETDRRRALIALTDKAAEAVSRYFAELGSAAAKMV